jgi:PAS domain S-box-containing protein
MKKKSNPKRLLTEADARLKNMEAFRASEIRYRRLFETAHDGVLLLDPGTRKITDANPFMTKLLGYSHSQLVGKELFEIGLLKDEVASKEMFRKLKRKHEVRYEDLPLESRGGRHQEVEVVANLYQEDGHAVIQCNIRDITERKAAEARLRASEERYRILFELGPVAVYACDAGGVIQDFNQRAVELWGRKPVAGTASNRYTGAFKLFRPDGSFLRHAQSPMAEVLRGKKAAERDREVIIERPDKTRIHVIVNIRALKNERGEITGAINCFYDITERQLAAEAQSRIEVLAASNQELSLEIAQRKAVEAALKKSERHYTQLLEKSDLMQEQLRQLSRQILSTQEEERREISRELHDVIAQTLTGINVRLAALAKEASVNTTGLDRNIARTQKLVEHSVDIVHRFARELRPAVLDDLGLIPALHTFVKDFSQRTGIHVELKAFAGVEQLDIAKRTVLFRVAQEALTNVNRHAKATQVELNIRELPSGIGMNIRDNGKSFQVDRTLNANAGKRLGLLGMRERVEMVGGTFCVESTPGHGTTVQVTMPSAKSRGGAETPIKRPAETKNS